MFQSDIPTDAENISNWRYQNALRVGFDGRKFYTTEVKIKPPNNLIQQTGLTNRKILEHVVTNCGCFKACTGDLVKVTDTRALWDVDFSAFCSQRHNYRYLIEQDFLME